MLKLTIDNSVCQLEGLSIEQHKKLKDILSYEISAQANFHAGGYRSTKRTLLGKNGHFPTGLCYLVEKFINHDLDPLVAIQTQIKDLRRVPQPLESTFKLSLGYEPYPEQIEAAKACKRFTRGIVCAPTGFGKSAVCALIINEVKVKTLVVVPSLELKRQLTADLQKAFKSQNVGSICDRPDIAVENVDAIDDGIDTQKILDYDCVIIDEFHHSGANTYRKLNKTAFSRMYYKFGLTATPFRSQDNEKLLLESVLSQVIYKVEYQTAVERGYIVPMEAYYIEVPRTVIKGNTKSWPSMYSELVVHNEERNNMIQKLLGTFHVNKLSTLCLVKEIAHGNNLVEPTYFANGDNEDTPYLITMFNNRTLKTLVGTTGVLGEGVNTVACEYVIIAGLGKSKNSIMQQVGRAFRRSPGKESCKIILISDKSHRWTIAHFKEQCKILKDEYNIIPSRLEL